MKESAGFVKITKEDVAILRNLSKDSRLPLSTLARQTHISRERLTYRLERLIREGVISSFVTETDPGKLGFMGAVLFLKLRNSKLQEAIAFVKSKDCLSWSTEFSGTWNLGFGIYGRSIAEIEKEYKEVLATLGAHMLYSELLYIQHATYYYHKYFDAPLPKKAKVRPCEIDSADKKILKALTADPRKTVVDLTRETKLNAATIQKHIAKLRAGEVITHFTIIVQLRKIGQMMYSIFFTPQNAIERNKLLNFCETHPDILFVCTYYNDARFEIGARVSNSYELSKVISAVEEFSPGTRMSSINLVQEEVLGSGLPAVCFR